MGTARKAIRGIAKLLEADSKAWLPFWKDPKNVSGVDEPWAPGQKQKPPKPPKKKAPSKFAAGSSFWDDVPSVSDLPMSPKEPPHGKPKKPEKWVSAGGVVIPSLHPDEINYVYIRQPSGKYGGKAWTLPKGRVDEGEGKKETAIREVEEEAGVVAKVLPGSNLGKFEGTMSVTYYYVMVQTTGALKKTDFETSKVLLLPFEEAIALMQKTGNYRDMKVLQKAQKWLKQNPQRGQFKRRMKMKRVQVALSELVYDLDMKTDDFKTPEGNVDESKIVIKLSNKRDVNEILGPLKKARVKPLDVIKGSWYHLVILDRDDYNRGYVTRMEPQTRRF